MILVPLSAGAILICTSTGARGGSAACSISGIGGGVGAPLRRVAPPASPLRSVFAGSSARCASARPPASPAGSAARIAAPAARPAAAAPGIPLQAASAAQAARGRRFGDRRRCRRLGRRLGRRGNGRRPVARYPSAALARSALSGRRSGGAAAVCFSRPHDVEHDGAAEAEVAQLRARRQGQVDARDAVIDRGDLHQFLRQVRARALEIDVRRPPRTRRRSGRRRA